MTRIVRALAVVALAMMLAAMPAAAKTGDQEVYGWISFGTEEYLIGGVLEMNTVAEARMAVAVAANTVEDSFEGYQVTYTTDVAESILLLTGASNGVLMILQGADGPAMLTILSIDTQVVMVMHAGRGLDTDEYILFVVEFIEYGEDATPPRGFIYIGSE